MTTMIPTLQISTGETILFGILAVAMIVMAIYGLLIARKAVYTVLSVIFVMVCLAFFYTMLEAPFMGVVQVVVYTGAILMMFLFVLMLIGVDSSDSEHETLKGQRVIAIVGAIGIFALLAVLLLQLDPQVKLADLGALIPAGLAAANEATNPVAVAQNIVSQHTLTLELTGTLLIVAALGAMTLTHRDRVTPKATQEQMAHAKVQAFTQAGENMNVKGNPGVYAESNSSRNPALTAYGQPLEDSVSRVLKVRHQDRSVAQASPVTAQRIARGEVPSGPATYGKVGKVQTWGMPGEAAPDYSSATSRKALDAAPAAAEVPAVIQDDAVAPEATATESEATK